MAVTLSLSYEERNDNKVFTFTDTSDDWGVGGNINPDGISTLTLDIRITDSSGTITAYDQIDLVSELGLGPASTQADLVFELNATHLTTLGTAYGTADDVLPDGVWQITYLLTGVIPFSSSAMQETILVYGNVRNAVYKLLRQMNTAYECDGCIDEGVLNVIFAKTYLDAMQVAELPARATAVVEQLYTLERILLNISKYDI